MLLEVIAAVVVILLLWSVYYQQKPAVCGVYCQPGTVIPSSQHETLNQCCFILHAQKQFIPTVLNWAYYQQEVDPLRGSLITGLTCSGMNIH